MFALIETKGATHIAINIPRDGADKTIPALVGMLEDNAVFISRNWSKIETCAPEMSIQLGDMVSFASSDEALAITIPNSTSVLDDSFVLETPEVKVSNKKAIDAKDAEIQRLQAELAHIKHQLEDLQHSVLAAADNDDEIQF